MDRADVFFACDEQAVTIEGVIIISEKDRGAIIPALYEVLRVFGKKGSWWPRHRSDNQTPPSTKG